jgi:hypothetical protein
MVKHLLAADLRRFHRWLALWMFVAAAGALLEQTSLRTAQPSRTYEMLELAALLIWLVDGLLVAALVTLVVQAHPAVGSEAFWMTRPIGPVPLLIAKFVLFTVTLIGVSVTIDGLVMSAYGVSAGDMARVSLQTAIMRAVLLALIAAIAALSATPVRAVWTGGTVLLVMGVAVVILDTLVSAFKGTQSASELAAVSAAADSSHVLLYVGAAPARTTAAMVLLAGGIAVVIVQYLLRPRLVGWAVLAATLAGALAADFQRPYLAWPRALPPPDWTGSESALQLDLDPNAPLGGVSETPWVLDPHRGSAQVVRGGLRVHGVQPGWGVIATFTRASLRFDDGRTLESLSMPGSTPLWAEGTASRSVMLQRLLSVTQVVDADRYQEPRAVLFVAREDEWSAHARRSARYAGEFALHLSRYDVASTVPVQPGAAAHDGAYGLVLDEVTLDDKLLRIRARGWRVATMFDTRPRPGYEFYLRNVAAGEAVAASDTAQEMPLVPSLGSVHIDPGSRGFAVGRMEIWFRRSRNHDEAWFRNAELVMVRTRYEGSVTRTLLIPNLSVNVPAK